MTVPAARVIAHVDMDAFFAAVEQRDDPRLRGLPVIVGADPKGGRGRGVVSTCSYEARRFGIHSAMPISEAYRRCPRAVFLPPDFSKYSRVSRQVFGILYQFTPQIQPISVDEAFMDLTGSVHFYGTPLEAGRRIKAAILKQVQLTASIGIAPNKMVAKIASAHGKPDGLLEVQDGRVLDFLWPLPVGKLWGVGEKTQTALERLRIKTVGDLARRSRDELYEKFKESGLHLYVLAHGQDDREVEIVDDVKSVSHEHTFEEDTGDRAAVLRIMLALSEKVSHRLRQDDLKGKTVTVKIRLAGFKTYTRAVTIDRRTNFVDTIYAKARELFEGFFRTGMKVRLIGVRVSNFEEPYVQDSLFADAGDVKKESVHKAVDVIKDRFGEESIHWGP